MFSPDYKKNEWQTKIIYSNYLDKYLSKIPFFFRDYFSKRCLEQLLVELHPDIINIHNFHGAPISPKIVNISRKYAPVFWTLHDTWSYTGRCAYTYDCKKFITGCDSSCPTAKEYPPMSPYLISHMWIKHKNILEKNKDIVAICPSKWLSKEAGQGIWSGHRIETIPNGLPLNIYKHVNKQIARKALEIGEKDLVLLCAAENINDRRKGGDILVKALNRVTTRPIKIITFGRTSINGIVDDINMIHLGYVNPERVKVLAYNAADLLIHAAPVDNLPNVVMESIACGTPVVAFPVGGVPDLVREGKTGWLASEISPDSLAKTIDIALDDIYKGNNLKDSCLSIAGSEYDSMIQAKKYLELFRTLT